jgi:hypothetical protein
MGPGEITEAAACATVPLCDCLRRRPYCLNVIKSRDRGINFRLLR